jgi:octaprenyl-diphosphate synthase
VILSDGTRRSAEAGQEKTIALLTTREIFDLVRDDLVLVEQELTRHTSGAFERVSEITSYLLGGGGKRLRPALLLLSARYAGTDQPASGSAIRLAAVVELLHTATLIHDDVIDSAATRRGRPSANSRWGNHRSVLVGDWLYMLSFQMALEERNFRILDILIDLTQKMVEGELLQLEKIGRIDVSEEDALRLATYKTACLFSGCARLGAVLGRLEDVREEALAEYGRYAGLAFQLVDDLLDFTASAEQLGKPVLSDLKEGKVTLPLIYAMENGHLDAREMVARVLQEKEFDSVRPETIVALVQESGALDRARSLAHDYAARAKACLNGCGHSEYARALLTLPDFILEREN